VKGHVAYGARPDSRRVADLQHKTAELEHQLHDARLSLEQELAGSRGTRDSSRGPLREPRCVAHESAASGTRGARRAAAHAGPRAAFAERPDHGRPRAAPDDRTELFVSHGRSNAYHPAPARWRALAIGTAVIAVVLTIGVMTLAGGGSAWPASVTRVQGEAAKACRNPDVKAEPGQVNFACARATRQILWIFALLTSGGNPAFGDAHTGRLGLEPITPAQGGQIAWSLNLHHPYNPASPIDSLQVAARAINNIIAGATLTGLHGGPVVQPGLESSPASCLRYTGSAAVTARKGFPALCAKPVTSPAGQAALVADVFQKWVVGATPQAAQNAAVLFLNAQDPGNPRVQAILRHLP
jgi:hypothetical protein